MKVPGISSITISETGQPVIRGYRCTACGAAAERPTLACRRCLARGTVEEFQPALNGKLVTWSIVHRSYPGVPVPFVSAIVELESGLTLKGNLNGCDAKDLHAGMPVVLEFDDAGGKTDKDGNAFVAYHFARAA